MTNEEVSEGSVIKKDIKSKFPALTVIAVLDRFGPVRERLFLIGSNRSRYEERRKCFEKKSKKTNYSTYMI